MTRNGRTLWWIAGLGAAALGAYVVLRPAKAAASTPGVTPPGGISEETLKDQAVMALSSVPRIEPARPAPELGPQAYVPPRLDVSALVQAAQFFNDHGGGNGLWKYVEELQLLQQEMTRNEPPRPGLPGGELPWSLYYWAMYNYNFDPRTGETIAAGGYPQIGAVVQWYTQEGSPNRASASTRARALELVRTPVGRIQ